MHRNLFRVQLLSVLLVLLMVIGIAPQAVWAGQVLERNEEVLSRPFMGYDLDSIYVFYDPKDEVMKAVADGIQEILSVRIINVIMVPVRSYSDFQFWLLDDPWIAVYAFRSNLNHVLFSDQELLWKQFYQVLNEHRSTQHIVAMGNTLSLQPFLTENDRMIHTSESEQTDGLIMILYGVWGIMDTCKQRAQYDPTYQGAADDLEKMVLTIYGDQFNEFFKRTVEPVNPVGEMDPAAAEIRRQRMWARHPGSVADSAYTLMENGSLEEVPLDQLPESFAPVIQLSTLAEVETGSFVLGELPLFSGLSGPIGKILDVLLDLLIGSGESVISIPEDTLSNLKDVFDTIQPFLGIVSDFDLDSPLKSIISGLISEFPFPEDLKKYLEPILKALFNMRGDFSSILGVVGELLEGLLPEIIPQEIMDWLDTVLDLGGEFWSLVQEVIEGGKGAFNTILSYVTDNILSGLLNKVLTATFGLLPGDVVDLVNKAVATISSIVDYIASFDFSQFIADVGQKLIQTAFGLLTDVVGQDTLDRIMAIIKMGVSALDLVDSFDQNSLIELVTSLVDEFFGPGIITAAEDFARDLMEVVKNYSEQVKSSISEFQTEIMSIINTQTSGIAQNVKDVVRDALTLVGGFFNEGFNPADVPDIFDVVQGAVNLLPTMSYEYTLADAAEVMEVINGAVKPMLGVIAMATDSEGLKKMVSRTVSSFESELGSIPDVFTDLIKFVDVGDVLPSLPNLDSVLSTFGEISGGIMNMIGAVRHQSFQGIMQSLLMAVGSMVGMYPDFDDVDISAYLKLLQAFFPESFDLDKYSLNINGIVNEILSMAADLLPGVIDITMLEDILNFLMDIKGVFTDGIQWLLGKAFDWLTGMITPLLEDLEDTINGLFGGANDLMGKDGTLPIGLGDWSLFELTYDLGIRANFKLDPTPFFELLRGVIFEGRNPFTLDDIGDFFKIIFSFFEISPQFYAEVGVTGFDSSKNPFMDFLLSMLGLELSFSGSAHFVLTLFTFRGGEFEWEDFFNIVEWGLSLDVGMKRTITLLDFVTGGVGGGVLGKLGKYLGLDSISVDIWLNIELDIVKKAATALEAEVSTLTLALTLGVAINLGIDILIAAAKLRGSLEIILTFFQDLSSSAPMHIVLRLIFTLKLTIRFLFWDWDSTWTWEPGGPWDLSPGKDDEETKNSGIGFDSDDDGLGDEYEATIPGLNPNAADTDNDGASDKLEVKTMGSDPVNPDSDGDGLLDGEEWDLGTNPMFPDSDWDDLSDYDEARVYMTDPLCQDTDGDALTDAYEVFTAWDISTVTPTVTEVVIGGTSYNDHTDPLNPDTDGDGLMDGDEGPTGCYYGLPSLYNTSVGSPMDPNPLIFGGGYTHPLDSDTDDDSYLQLYNGAVDTQALLFLKDMNDGAEVAGFWIILYDSEGEPERKQVFTNPCNPDTDGDTGVTDRTPQPGAWLNSDGYELAQTPPTDPTDGDTDDDGLLDGLEGVLNQNSNHTDPTDPDTDDDGLFDMQEMLLRCDPRSSDTDLDMISDGEEFYRFFTNPFLPDSDFDGLSDGEEVWMWHTNPLADDSDGDYLSDGLEVLVYGSDPMDEDGDNDGLTDYEEILVYGTDPFDYDSDDDQLSDGEEILYYGCNPLAWDTDLDSVTEPNELGDMTWPMSDYDEVMIWGTNVTEPDSDMDGLSDGIELYLGSGLIPWLDPIPLDPLSKDTDHDWLADGTELNLMNVSDIVYPFLSVTVVLKYNTSPVEMDSDGDTLTDYQEVNVFNTNPACNDTDNDTLGDWWEVWVYNTSAISNDTDGDQLWDLEENVTALYPHGPWPPSSWNEGMTSENETPWGEPPPEPVYPVTPASIGPPSGFVIAQTKYQTSATDWDSDGDWLPDGAEVYMYGSNPLNDDSDSDGIADTYEFDTDYDGLPDGIEFRMGLQTLPNGGIFQPDSDLDGLLDGEEYFVYHTHCAKADTDGDGYSDGLEVALGLDPLEYTSGEEFNLKLAVERGSRSLRIMTPANSTKVYQNTPLSVANFTPFQNMWFRFRNGSDWSQNHTLGYNPSSGMWQNVSIRWQPGSYELQVFGLNNTGVTHAAVSYFVVQSGDDPFWRNVMIAGAAAVGTIFLVGLIDYKTGKVRAGLRRLVRRGGTKPATAASAPKTKENAQPESSGEEVKKKRPSKGKKTGGE